MVRQVEAFDAECERFIEENCWNIAGNGKLILMISNERKIDPRDSVHIIGTYHRVVENEWESVRFFKNTGRVGLSYLLEDEF